jgi:alpha-beta hydrolase superfamily lysophospholipase
MAQGFRPGITRLSLATNPVLDYQYVRALAFQPYGGASTGEILQVAGNFRQAGATRRAWIESWAAQGRHVRGIADAALEAGQRVTARQAYLRAYNYLRAAEFYHGLDDRMAHIALYEESVACFDAAMRLLDTPVEKIAIPYERGITMPGYFFKVDDSAQPRPTIILCGGGDGYGEELYFLTGVPDALARGFNALVFHGPGQRGLLLYHPGEHFRPDYEVPLRAVVDYALSRPDVHADQLALYGISLGGYLAPRAAACDERIKALIANSPMLSLYGFMFSGVLEVMPRLLQPTIRRYADRIPRRVWDVLEARTRRKDWVHDAIFELYMAWANDVQSFAEYLDRIKAFTLDERLVANIGCPTLSISAAGEGAEPIAQAQRFHTLLQAPKTFYTLRTIDGADNHCGLNNVPHTCAIVYDWLCGVFAENTVKKHI